MPLLLIFKPFWDFLTGLPWQVWAAIVCIVAAYFGVTAYGDAQRLDERRAWQDKIAKADAEWQIKIDAINAANRTRMADHAEAIAAISTHYQTELKNAQAQRVADRAAVQRGALRLSDPGATDFACLARANRAGTSPSGRDDRAPGQLSDAAAEFLLELVADADDVARQLTAAQAVIVEDRKLCGRQGEPTAPIP